MGWLDIDLNEIEKEQTKMENTYTPLESGVYEAVINNIYVDKLSTGTTYFSMNITINGNRKLNLDRFSVERMIKSKEGKVKMSNGRYFTGIILLDKIAKIKGKNINQLTPTKGVIELFGEKRTVGIFKDLINTKIAIGIRKVLTSYKGNEYENWEVVNICSIDDEKCIESTKKRIEKNPIKDNRETNKQADIEVKEDEELPF